MNEEGVGMPQLPLDQSIALIRAMEIAKSRKKTDDPITKCFDHQDRPMQLDCSSTTLQHPFLIALGINLDEERC